MTTTFPFLKSVAACVAFGIASFAVAQDFPAGYNPNTLEAAGVPAGYPQQGYPEQGGAGGGYPQQGYPQAAPQAAPPADDSSSVAAVINSMDRLDDARALKVGDYIAFRIVQEGAVVKRLRIMDSGEIQVPHIGLVRAQGFTPKQLGYIVKSELDKEMFVNSAVIVTVDTSWVNRHGAHNAAANQTYNPHGYGHNNPMGRSGYIPPNVEQVTIFGQVGRQGPMALPFDGELTITTAILQAGGFARFANTRRVEIHRLLPGSERERRVILVNVDNVMRRGKLTQDIALRSNDVIYVHEKLFNF